MIQIQTFLLFYCRRKLISCFVTITCQEVILNLITSYHFHISCPSFALYISILIIFIVIIQGYYKRVNWLYFHLINFRLFLIIDCYSAICKTIQFYWINFFLSFNCIDSCLGHLLISKSSFMLHIPFSFITCTYSQGFTGKHF